MIIWRTWYRSSTKARSNNRTIASRLQPNYMHGNTACTLLVLTTPRWTHPQLDEFRRKVVYFTSSALKVHVNLTRLFCLQVGTRNCFLRVFSISNSIWKMAPIASLAPNHIIFKYLLLSSYRCKALIKRFTGERRNSRYWNLWLGRFVKKSMQIVLGNLFPLELSEVI